MGFVHYSVKCDVNQIEPWTHQSYQCLLILDMKHGMMDVGMLCSQSRLGINTEKGKVSRRVLYTPDVFPHMLITRIQIFPHIMWLLFVLDCNITKFLNRILGLEVHKQNSLFQYFTDNFDYLIEKDKKEGKYDMGILGKQH